MPTVANGPEGSPLNRIAELGFSAVSEQDLADLLQLIEQELCLRGWAPQRIWTKAQPLELEQNGG